MVCGIVVEPIGVSQMTTCDASGAESEPDCVSVTSPVTSSGRAGVLAAEERLAFGALGVFAAADLDATPLTPIVKAMPAIAQSRSLELFESILIR